MNEENKEIGSSNPLVNNNGQDEGLTENTTPTNLVNNNPFSDESPVVRINQDVVLSQSLEATQVTPEESSEPISYAGQEEVILEVKQKKEKGPWGVIFLFLILVSFVVFLPQLTPYINDYLNKEDNQVKLKPEQKEKDPDDQIQKEVFLTLSSDLLITNKDFELSAINIMTTDNLNYFITFNIKNKGKIAFDFNKKYYLQLYNAEETLLSRVKIYDSLPLEIEEMRNLKLPSKAEAQGATKVSIVVLDVKDYPAITITPNEAGEQVLSCTYQNEQYNYLFSTDLLKTINITNSDQVLNYALIEEYNNVKKNASLAMAKLSNIDGITGLFSETVEGFTTAVDINLNTTDAAILKELDKYEYFALDTLAKTIHFEMKAMGYTCQ